MSARSAASGSGSCSVVTRNRSSTSCSPATSTGGSACRTLPTRGATADRTRRVEPGRGMPVEQPEPARRRAHGHRRPAGLVSRQERLTRLDRHGRDTVRTACAAPSPLPAVVVTPARRRRHRRTPGATAIALAVTTPSEHAVTDNTASAGGGGTACTRRVRVLTLDVALRRAECQISR
jgi:hypothetical protein